MGGREGPPFLAPPAKTLMLQVDRRILLEGSRSVCSSSQQRCSPQHRQLERSEQPAVE